MKIKVLTTPQEMVDQIEVMRFLYPNLTEEKYSMYLQEMVKHSSKTDNNEDGFGE